MRFIVTPADLPQYVPGEIWLDAVDGRCMTPQECRRQDNRLVPSSSQYTLTATRAASRVKAGWVGPQTEAAILPPTSSSGPTRTRL